MAVLRQIRKKLAEAKGQSPTHTYPKIYEGEKYSVWHVDAYCLPQKIWQEDGSERTHILWIEWHDRLDAVRFVSKSSFKQHEAYKKLS